MISVFDALFTILMKSRHWQKSEAFNIVKLVFLDSLLDIFIKLKGK